VWFEREREREERNDKRMERECRSGGVRERGRERKRGRER
jgi:hypothetical protein